MEMEERALLPPAGNMQADDIGPAEDGYLNEEVEHLLLKADIRAVDEQLGELERILSGDGSDFKAVTRLQSTMRGETFTETFLHLIFYKYHLRGADPVKETEYNRAVVKVLQRCEEWAKDSEKREKLNTLFNEKDGQGRTVLHLAILLWSKKVIKRLLNIGLDLGTGEVLNKIGVDKIHPSLVEEILDTMWFPR